MKKLILLVFFVIVAANAFGQNNFMSEISLLNLNRYASHLGFRNGVVNTEQALDNRYLWAASDEDLLQFGGLAGTDIPDIPLEIALLSYYSRPVIQIRPVEADAILPANNPRLADTKLGAALFQEIQVLRFLADTNAVGRYEGMLKFITDRGNVTRAEIETHYRSGIRDLVSEIVNEEFNKISFLIDRTRTTGSSYGAVLTRNTQNGHYILSYEGYFNGTLQTKTLSASSLEALTSAMSRSADFIQDDINQVRAQAALMPVVVLSNTALTEIIDILTSIL